MIRRKQLQIGGSGKVVKIDKYFLNKNYIHKMGEIDWERQTLNLKFT